MKINDFLDQIDRDPTKIPFITRDFVESAVKSDIPSLVEAIKNENKHLRFAAIYALGKIGNELQTAQLLDVIKDEDYEIRGITCWALGMLKDKSTVPYLIKLIDDPEIQVQEYVIESLGKIKEPLANSVLIKKLDDSNLDIKLHCVWAIGEISNIDAIPTLMNLLELEMIILSELTEEELMNQEIHEDIFIACANSLAKIEKNNPGSVGMDTVSRYVSDFIEKSEDQKKAIEKTRYFRILKKEIAQIRESRISVLPDSNKESGDDSLIMRLIELFETPLQVENAMSLVLNFGDQAIGPLIESIERNEFASSGSVQALGKIDNPKVLDFLIEKLGSEDELLRNEAARAIASIEKKHPGSVELKKVRISLNNYVEFAENKSAAITESAKLFQIIIQAIGENDNTQLKLFDKKRPLKEIPNKTIRVG